MYNFVYKTVNNLNGDYYIGVHSTNNLDDGYMGSGIRIRRSINKYGLENFSRTVIKFFDCKKDAYLLEAEIVTPELLQDPHCLNLNVGGHGGSIKGELNPLYGTTFSEEHCNKIKNALTGKPKTEEHKQKLRKPKTEEHKQKLRGRQKSDIERQHISEGTKKAMKGYFLEHPRKSEQYQKMWETRRKNGTTNTNNGKHQPESAKQTMRDLKWMTNGSETIRVNVNEINLFLNKGYKLGRK